MQITFLFGHIMSEKNYGLPCSAIWFVITLQMSQFLANTHHMKCVF